jgi:hypothetical protein
VSVVPMAEGERFELSTLITQGKRLAGARTRPLCDPSSWHPLLYHNRLFSSKNVGYLFEPFHLMGEGEDEDEDERNVLNQGLIWIEPPTILCYHRCNGNKRSF